MGKPARSACPGCIIGQSRNYDKYSLRGDISLFDSQGKFIKQLSDLPASAIAIQADGNLIVGTCYHNRYSFHGGIALCDPEGKLIKQLSDLPASTIAIQADGNLIIGNCYYDGYSVHGGIALCDPEGKLIQQLSNRPVSAIATQTDNLIFASCYYDGYSVYGGLEFVKPILVERKTHPVYSTTTLLQKINESIVHNATMACIQFHKGTINLTEDISFLCRLPKDILNTIYSYVFPFPEMQKDTVVNRHCFPNLTTNDINKVFLAQEFAKKIIRVKFFESDKSMQKIITDHEPNTKQKTRRSKNKKCQIM